MSIEFQNEEIINWEKRNRKPYIGYFNPSGKLINYNIKIGGEHHETWDNPVSWTYLWFVSYIIKDTNCDNLRKINDELYQLGKHPNIKEEVIRGFSPDADINSYLNIRHFLDTLNDKKKKTASKVKNYSVYQFLYDEDDERAHDYTRFELDILDFLEKAYSNNEFFNAINRKIMVKKRMNEKNIDIDKAHYQYQKYVIEELMSHFKDIAVQYLCYDSIERFTTDNQGINYNTIKDYDPYVLAIPRKITTSCLTPNERFYNYLAMDWEINVLPRYFFNKETSRFETHNILNYYETEKEKVLKKELQSLKRSVPLNERYKYFR